MGAKESCRKATGEPEAGQRLPTVSGLARPPQRYCAGAGASPDWTVNATDTETASASR